MLILRLGRSWAGGWLAGGLAGWLAGRLAGWLAPDPPVPQALHHPTAGFIGIFLFVTMFQVELWDQTSDVKVFRFIKTTYHLRGSKGNLNKTRLDSQPVDKVFELFGF